MALVPDLKDKSYDASSALLSAVSMGIEVLGTSPRGQRWNGSWWVDYQTPGAGTPVDPVPIGYMVGVILKMPPVPPPPPAMEANASQQAGYGEITGTSG